MNKKFYYAIFNETDEAVEVEFPDLPSCATFGSNRDEAYENAIDVLTGWLANAESQFIKEPPAHSTFKNVHGRLIPIPVNDKIFESYQELKRFNVIFPANILNKIDSVQKKHGLKRSTFLLLASENYLKKISHNEHTKHFSNSNNPKKHKKRSNKYPKAS